uniref:Transmembrane protein 230 n=1 Tax=Panagrolaimus sp. JU765 TaxID=591449 RepID=A0AC34QCD1_9BILA
MKKRKSEQFSPEFASNCDDVQIEQQDIPWKGIVFAFLLLLIGIFFIFQSYKGYLDNSANHNSYVVLFAVGCISFIPGFYHLWIAYQAYYQVPGYNFEDIPNFD